MEACVLSHSVMCLTLCGLMNYMWPVRLLCASDFPGKNTGVGCHFLLGIFPTQESNPESLVPPALAGGFFTPAPPGKPL